MVTINTIIDLFAGLLLYFEIKRAVSYIFLNIFLLCFQRIFALHFYDTFILNNLTVKVIYMFILQLVSFALKECILSTETCENTILLAILDFIKLTIFKC